MPTDARRVTSTKRRPAWLHEEPRRAGVTGDREVQPPVPVEVDELGGEGTLDAEVGQPPVLGHVDESAAVVAEEAGVPGDLQRPGRQQPPRRGGVGALAAHPVGRIAARGLDGEDRADVPVRHDEVEVPVTVDVAEVRAPGGSMPAGQGGHDAQRPRPIGEPERAVIHEQPAELLAPAAKEEIAVTVGVDVGERRHRGRREPADPGPTGDVDEGAAVVEVEAAGASGRGQQQVQVAVVVEVGDRGAGVHVGGRGLGPPAAPPQTHATRDVDETDATQQVVGQRRGFRLQRADHPARP